MTVLPKFDEFYLKDGIMKVSLKALLCLAMLFLLLSTFDIGTVFETKTSSRPIFCHLQLCTSSVTLILHQGTPNYHKNLPTVETLSAGQQDYNLVSSTPYT